MQDGKYTDVVALNLKEYSVWKPPHDGAASIMSNDLEGLRPPLYLCKRRINRREKFLS